MSRFRKLRIECLENKNLLAGDVTAQLIGGDLFIEGDGADNSVQIVRDINLANPGVGDVLVQGLFSNPTTVNGSSTPVPFTVTGDVFIDFSDGGQNVALFGDNPSFQPDPVELPGNVHILGGAANEFPSLINARVDGNVSMDDTAGGASSSLGTSFGTVIGGNVVLDSAADLASIGIANSTVNGDVVMLGNSASQLSFLGISGSTIGDDVRHLSTALGSETEVESSVIGDDVVIDTGDGDSVVTFTREAFSTVDNQIGDDLRIRTGAGIDTINIAYTEIGDDLAMQTGAGADVIDVGNFDAGQLTVVGDDVRIRSGDDGDVVNVRQTNILDDLKISTGAGDDLVNAGSLEIGDDVLLSLGRGVDDGTIESSVIGSSVTVTGRGENVVQLEGLEVAHFVTVVTANGADEVLLEEVVTRSALIATGGGEDSVSLVDSEFERLIVLLGGGDDTLVIEGDVVVSRWAIFSGGSGEDTLDTSGGDLDANILLDFAFEIFEDGLGA